jgi:hypothetical protein
MTRSPPGRRPAASAKQPPPPCRLGMPGAGGQGRGDGNTGAVLLVVVLLNHHSNQHHQAAVAASDAARPAANNSSVVPLLRFAQPQFMGLGERPDGFLGLDSPAGEERIISSDLYAHSYRRGSWLPSHPLPRGVALPTQCGFPCSSVQVMPDTFAPVFATGNNLSAATFVEDDSTYGNFTSSIWSVAADGAELISREIEPRLPPRRFSGLPTGVIAFPCCGSSAEKYGFRTGGSASVRINASYYLQTALVRFANGRKEYNHTHIPTSVVVYRSYDRVKWEYLSTLANADDYPQSTEGPNEMDMVVLADGSLLSILRMDAGDGKYHGYLPYYQTRSANTGLRWTKLTPVRGAGSARPRLLVLEGAVLLSGGRFDAATATGVRPTAKG